MAVTPVAEPALAQAAALITHWGRGDIEAVVILLAGMQDRQELEDLVVAQLILRDKTPEYISRLLPPGGGNG